MKKIFIIILLLCSFMAIRPVRAEETYSYQEDEQNYFVITLIDETQVNVEFCEDGVIETKVCEYSLTDDGLILHNEFGNIALTILDGEIVDVYYFEEEEPTIKDYLNDKLAIIEDKLVVLEQKKQDILESQLVVCLISIIGSIITIYGLVSPIIKKVKTTNKDLSNSSDIFKEYAKGYLELKDELKAEKETNDLLKTEINELKNEVKDLIELEKKQIATNPDLVKNGTAHSILGD